MISIEFTDYKKYPLTFAGQEGIWERIISKADDGVGVMHIVEYAPGTDTTAAGVQIHDYWEYVFILEGSMIDLSLNQEFKAGSVAFRMPGMKHGPWKIPNGGCKLFEIKCKNSFDSTGNKAMTAQL